MSANNVDLRGLFSLGSGNELYNKSGEMKDGPYAYSPRDPERLQPKHVLRSFVLTLDLREPADIEVLQAVRQAAAAGSARITAQSEQWVAEDRNWRVLLIGYINEVMAPKQANDYWLTSAIKALEAIQNKQGTANDKHDELPGQCSLGKAVGNLGSGKAADSERTGVPG